MEKRIIHLLIAGSLLAIILIIPFSHHHPDTLYDPSCFAGKVESSLLAYTYLLFALVPFLIVSFPQNDTYLTIFHSSKDIYQLFINKAPPSPC
jgi:hypothetical protein